MKVVAFLAALVALGFFGWEKYGTRKQEAKDARKRVVDVFNDAACDDALVARLTGIKVTPQEQALIQGGDLPDSFWKYRGARESNAAVMALFRARGVKAEDLAFVKQLRGPGVANMVETVQDHSASHCAAKIAASAKTKAAGKRQIQILEAKLSDAKSRRDRDPKDREAYAEISRLDQQIRELKGRVAGARGASATNHNVEKMSVMIILMLQNPPPA